MRWWLRGCSRSADALCGLCGAEERTWSEKGTAAKQGRLAASSMASPNAIGTARVGCPSSHGNTTLSPLAASRWACHSSLAARCSLLAARCQPARCLDSLAAASPEQGCAPIHSPTPRPQRPSMRGPQFCPAVFFRDRSCALARRWLVPPVQSPDIAKLLFALSRPCDVCCLEPARCSDMMLVT